VGSRSQTEKLKPAQVVKPIEMEKTLPIANPVEAVKPEQAANPADATKPMTAPPSTETPAIIKDGGSVETGKEPARQAVEAVPATH
jgi:hypothetical protein